MSKKIFAVLALGLAAAAALAQGSASLSVEVSGGAVSGSTRMGPNQTAVTLQVATPGYRIASGGLDLGDAQGALDCSVAGDGKSAQCTKTGRLPAGRVGIGATLEPDGSVPSAARSARGQLWIQHD